MALVRSVEVKKTASLMISGNSKRLWAFTGGTLLLGCLFCFPIAVWVDYIRDEKNRTLYSYLAWIPLVSVYLAWLLRGELSLANLTRRRWAVIPAAVALVVVGCYWMTASRAWEVEDYLFVMVLSFEFALAALIQALFGWANLRRVVYPVAILMFSAPFPSFLISPPPRQEHTPGPVIGFLQNASAEAAYYLIKASGTELQREHNYFKLAPSGNPAHITVNSDGGMTGLNPSATALLRGDALEQPGGKLNDVLRFTNERGVSEDLVHRMAGCPAGATTNFSGMIAPRGLPFHVAGTASRGTAGSDQSAFEIKFVHSVDMNVAPECSGIHSTVVLFITSLVAGHIFLRGLVARGLLTLIVIPLAILRNGLRIFVLGLLSTHWMPDTLDANSFVHHRAGYGFFALSLIPFFALLLFLRSRDPEHKQELK